MQKSFIDVVEYRAFLGTLSQQLLLATALQSARGGDGGRLTLQRT